MKGTLRKKIHRTFAGALAAAVLFGLVHTGNLVTYAYEEKSGMICFTEGYIIETKDSPSPEGNKVSGLVYGKPVTIVDEEIGTDGEKWYKITYYIKDGTTEMTAYCKAADILLDENTVIIATGKTNANNVTLWSCVGDYKKPEVVTVNSGTRMEILDSYTSNGSVWYRVRCTVNSESYIGWIESQYITQDELPDIETDEDYEAYLTSIGFPESYVDILAVLHERYPNWEFVPVLTGLDWNAVIKEESKSGRNLVYKTENDAKKSIAASEYDWYTNTWTIRDTTGWVTAHPDFIAYCMDPRNFLNDVNIFMFESLSYSESQTEDGVISIIKNTFMNNDADNGDGTTLDYSEAFMAIAAETGVSPYHLASRVRQEQGKGTSPLISGKYTGYEGYYNYFNVGAYGTGDVVYLRGLSYAKSQGWDTRYKSLLGGATFIKNSYIGVGQDTLYFQKFDVIPEGGMYTHQYMTNVQGAISESNTLGKAYDKTQKFVFKIPVYENMPQKAVKFTASGNPNNYLSDLQISGLSLTPTFDGATTEYSIIVDSDISSIKVSATPVVSTSKVVGTGTHKLDVGENTIKVTCTSETGVEKTYTLTVVRQTPPLAPGEPEEPLTPETPVVPEIPVVPETPSESETTTESETPTESEKTEQPESVPSQKPGETDTPQEPTYTVNSSTYVIGDTYITGVEPKTTVADFKKKFICDGVELKVTTASGEENTGTIATGNKLLMYANNNLIATKEIVIYGDLTGDGKVTALDAIKLNRYTIGTSKLSGAYRVAADVNKDGKINALDAIIINRYTIGLSDIKQK